MKIMKHWKKCKNALKHGDIYHVPGLAEELQQMFIIAKTIQIQSDFSQNPNNLLYRARNNDTNLYGHKRLRIALNKNIVAWVIIPDLKAYE